MFFTALSFAVCTFFTVNYGDKAITKLNNLPFKSSAKSTSSVASAKIKKAKQVSALPKAQVNVSTFSTSSSVKKGKPAGKIISQFFSPYTTATESYNNVYVNNKSGVKINIKELLNGYKKSLSFNSSNPQVLIFHTHATESYMKEDFDSYYASDIERTEQENKSVIGVGNKLKSVLEKGGIKVLHDKTLHDKPSYNGGYSRSYNTVSGYLKKYKQLKIIIDLHRDAVADGNNLIKPVKKINGKNAAQVMVCVGSNTGTVNYYPKYKENLKLGLKLNHTLEVMYPGLARSLFFANDRCWNQNLSQNMIIIEFGTCANTFAEAEYSALLVGKAILTMAKE